MKLRILVSAGVLVFALSLVGVAYAEQDVNFLCKNDCLVKGGTQGKCNTLCSTASESGEKTKDMSCLSSCMAKSNSTAYGCYSQCDTSGSTPRVNSGETAPQITPGTGGAIKH